MDLYFNTGIDLTRSIPGFDNYDQNSVNGLISYIKDCEKVMDIMVDQLINKVA